MNRPGKVHSSYPARAGPNQHSIPSSQCPTECKGSATLFSPSRDLSKACLKTDFAVLLRSCWGVGFKASPTCFGLEKEIYQNKSPLEMACKFDGHGAATLMVDAEVREAHL